MRNTTYTCDRCGKTMKPKFATKLNMTIQKGDNPAEKKPYDFCSTCFLRVKSAFLDSLRIPADREPVEQMEPVMEKDTAREQAVKSAKDVPVGQAATMDMPVTEQIKGTAAEQEKTDAQDGSTAGHGIMDAGQHVLGPISPDERMEILRLYVYDGLSAEQIAAKMNRLTKGIRRAINSAMKSGELDRMRKEKDASLEMQANTDAVDYTREDTAGSGASNAGIMKDAYTAPPNMETINGKRYDVGCILALSNAGWPTDEIAKERHYDEDVVRLILEKYL